ncbi:PrsW family intramembrane metalloprotease [Candidatus Nomurabacteria bacterium]|nr:PrsW family intramembrane metalloprotease [Candidatus Nomurabacteria bacterium]
MAGGELINEFISSPVGFSILTGFVPSFIWLLFWLRLDRRHREPFVLLFICFCIGAASVLFATLLQGGVRTIMSDIPARVVVFAGIEETLKFLVFYMVAQKSSFNDEPIDAAMYLITVALGFAALENIFYVLSPVTQEGLTAGLLTGGFRFFGSTLLHAISSGFIGIIIALTPRGVKKIGMLVGLASAIAIHSTFNFFILREDTASFLRIYGYLWVAAIINLLILEKLRRLPPFKPLPTISS